MKSQDYKFSSPKLDGSIILSYNDGILRSILFDLKTPLSQQQEQWFLKNILEYAFREPAGDTQFERILLSHLVKIVQPAANNKVSLFCEYYSKNVKDKDGNPVEYKRGRKDHLVLRTYDVTPELLTTYFNSENILFKNKYSIGNYIKFYNQLRAEAAGATKTVIFKNYYDKEFEARMDAKTMQQYWEHLRENGWEFVNGTWREKHKQ
jgi:hypothetical protein